MVQSSFHLIFGKRIPSGKMPVNMVFDNAFGYEIRHFKNYSREWPTFQVRELVLHPATERVSMVICVMKSSQTSNVLTICTA